MTQALAIKDMRLLLFQALERGAFWGPFLQEWKEDGVGMSLEFADKYYNLTSEVYLRQASYCVLGIINLGLVISSENNVDNAVKVLRQNDLLKVFQIGWDKISHLASLKQEIVSESLHQSEKDFSEIFAAQPDKKWIGWKEYKTNLRNYSSSAKTKKLHHYLVKKYASIDIFEKYEYDPAKEVLDYDENNIKTQQILSTLFFSLLCSNKPFAPLKARHLREIAQSITLNFRLDWYTEEIHKSFDIPNDLKESFEKEVILFLEDDFAQILKERKDKARLIALLYNMVVILDPPNEISAEIIEAERGRQVNHIDSQKTAGMVVATIMQTTGGSKRLALITTVLEKINFLSNVDILDFLLVADGQWQGKIEWLSIKQEIFVELLDSKMMTTVLKDIFDQNHETKFIEIFKNLNPKILSNILREVDFARDFFIQEISIPANYTLLYDGRLGAEIFLVDPKKWYDLWFDTGSSEYNRLFQTFLKEAEYMGYKKQEASQMLFERIANIALSIKDIPDMCDIKPPFYNQSLRDNLKASISNHMYRKFYKQLKEKLVT